MKNRIICPVCKGTCKEIFKYIDSNSGQCMEEQTVCKCCEGQGNIYINEYENEIVELIGQIAHSHLKGF